MSDPNKHKSYRLISDEFRSSERLLLPLDEGLHLELIELNRSAHIATSTPPGGYLTHTHCVTRRWTSCRSTGSSLNRNRCPTICSTFASLFFFSECGNPEARVYTRCLSSNAMLREHRGQGVVARRGTTTSTLKKEKGRSKMVERKRTGVRESLKKCGSNHSVLML